MSDITAILQDEAQKSANAIEDVCRALEALTGHDVELVRVAGGTTRVTIKMEAVARAEKGGAS